MGGRGFGGGFGAGIGWVLGGCLVLIVLTIGLFVGCAVLIGASYDEKSSGTSSGSKGGTTSSQPLEPYVLSGNGQGVTKAFNLAPGLRTFEMEYDGGAKYEFFDVELLNQDGTGRASDTLFTEMLESGQPFSGSQAVQIQTKGSYVLQVKADGPWQVTIT